MNYSLPVIVNANGSMADFDPTVVCKLPDVFSNEQLVEALETLWQNRELREKFGLAGREIILQQHDSQICAELYKSTIERFYTTNFAGLSGLLTSIAQLPGSPSENTDLIPLAKSISATFPPRNRPRQLLVDISELMQQDARAGIQHDIRNFLSEWLHIPLDGYRLEPVYASPEHAYRYARSFTTRFLNLPDYVLHDEPIDYELGDLFLGLDLRPEIVLLHQDFYHAMRCQGVIVNFLRFSEIADIRRYLASIASQS
jgi:hypothetical protein